MSGIYRLEGQMQTLFNLRGIGLEQDEYESEGLVFICEDGQITHIGLEVKDDKRREGA